jgi:hypothetical protein
VAALRPWEAGILDIANCERAEFVVGLNDGEAAGTRVENWPSEVRALIEQDVNRWIKENTETRTVRAMTTAAPKHDGFQSCVLILHYSSKQVSIVGNSSERNALHMASARRRGRS